MKKMSLVAIVVTILVSGAFLTIENVLASQKPVEKTMIYLTGDSGPCIECHDRTCPC